MTPAADKPSLRRQFAELRKLALAACQEALDAAVSSQLGPVARPEAGIGLYWPTRSEPRLHRAALELQGQGRWLALPRVEGPHLEYHPWQPGEALSPDDCGIPAPAAGQPLGPGALAVLLVPALALDQRGIRLGSGGGWYDRLRADPAWRAIPALAVLPAACLTGRLPSDPWDVPFDGWLDEHGLHWC